MQVINPFFVHDTHDAGKMGSREAKESIATFTK